MKVYFKNSKGERIFVGEANDVNSGVNVALDDLKVRAPHFKSYYQRVWQDDNGDWWVDVSDHICFYIITVD